MIEQAIYTRITTFAGLSSLIGTRIYPNQFPKGVSYPAIRYFTVDDPSVAQTHDGGPEGLASPRYQFDIYDTTPNGAKLVRDQLKFCLEGYSGTVAGVIIQGVLKANGRSFPFEDEVGLFRESLDFFFWHTQPTS